MASTTDPAMAGEIATIFNEILFSLGFYHIVLGVLGAAFFLVWKSEGIFED